MDLDILRKGLRAMSDNVPAVIQFAKVVSVDEEKYVCECKLLSTGVKIYNVSLSAKESTEGSVLIPKEESDVLIARIEGQNNFFVLMVSEVNKIFTSAEEIVFNKGELKGLPKSEALVSRLNTIENAFNELLSLVKSHSHPNHNVVSSTLQSLSVLNPITKLSDIENPKIKQ